MKSLQSFIIRHKMLLTVAFMLVIVAAILIAGGAPDCFGP